MDMTTRPTPLFWAVVLLMVIGISGVADGAELVNVATGSLTSVAIGAGIGVYGLACAAAGLGIGLLRHWGWWLGLVSILIGLVVLVAIQGFAIGAGLDPVLAFGFVVWGVTLALLVTPDTRRAIRT
jgi:hypothetical protein